MRILANYGYKNNGDTYSVTFETIGDVPKDKADATVDELFGMAKQAIERQLNPDADPLEFPPREEVVAIPEPKDKKNSKDKPQIKDPDAPATKKQKSLIIHLAKERGQFIDGLNGFTMQEASEKIEELMGVAV